jgi:hypothetical protein
MKNRVFYTIKNFTKYKAKNYKIPLINCFRIKRYCLKEIIRKYFNMFLFITKKVKIEEEINVVDKLKSAIKEIGSCDLNIIKILELDNEKMVNLLKSVIIGNGNLK